MLSDGIRRKGQGTIAIYGMITSLANNL